MEHRVFISHANQDSAFAQRLANDLRRAGADVWLDATHIGPGDFVQRISQAINARDVLVLILTPDALRSQWVPSEMNAAIVRYKQGFMHAPVVVEARAVALQDIPALWTTYNRISAVTDYAHALSQVARALELALPAARSFASTSESVSTPMPMRHAASPLNAATSSGPRALPDTNVPGVSSKVDVPMSSAGASRELRSAPSVQPAALVSLPPTLELETSPTLSRRSLLIVAGAITVGAASVGGATWLTRMNAGAGTTHATSAGTTHAKRWSFKTGDQVRSSPAISNGIVYVGSYDHFIYAVDATTGTERWRYKTGDVVYSSPAVANGLVYVGSYDGALYALDASNGTKRWSHQTGFYIDASPIVANDTVFVSSADGNMYALDSIMGAKRWTFFVGSSSSSLAVAGSLVYVSSDNGVYALDASTGTQRWSYQPSGSIITTPAVANGMVYIGSEDHNVYALDANSGTARWGFYQSSGPIITTPAVANGTVYIGSEDHNIYAFDASTGTKRWSYLTGDVVASSPSVANSTIYIGSNDQSLYALDASTGTKRWSYQTARPVISRPAVANAVVYISSTDGNLYAINA